MVIVRQRVAKLFLCFLVVGTSLTSLASSQSTSHDAQAAKKFVQGFYDWYAPMACADHDEVAYAYALKERSSSLGVKLKKGLQEDFAAQAKANADPHAEAEIVGLDWDPFLVSQDPVPKYKVLKVTRRGRSYIVKIWSVPTAHDSSVTGLDVEVVKTAGRWSIVDLLYGDHDIFDTLRELKRIRNTPSKHGKRH